MKPKVLFLCTGNSCRSQMAEGWARTLLGDKIDVYSAGTELHGLNPNAVKVMSESGVDISKHHSKTLDSLNTIKFDLIVTVCENAAASCPTPHAKTKVVHAPFDDPPKLARYAATEEEGLIHYRRVRDQIKDFIIGLSF